ncbi:MAG: outer membrane beta-barrel protein, partial [Bacteroidota bacterium]
MQKLLSLFFICFSSVLTYSQTYYINGSITDTHQQPVSGVLISASNMDSVLMDFTISTDNGKYQLSIKSPSSSEEITLHTSHVAYSDTSLALKLTKESQTKNLVLKQEQYVIDDIEITSKRLPLRMEDGKIIADISKIPGFQSADIQKILNRLPAVTANSRQGISFNGQKASIYIDGRKQNMNDEQVLNFLKSLPADAIRNIVINSMDLAGYDASTGVVIDIQTKTRNIDGYYASIAGNIKRFDNNETAQGVQGFYIFQKNNLVFNTSLSYADVYKHSTSEDSTLYNNGNKTRLFNTFKSRSNIFTTTTNLNWQLKNSTLNANFFVYYEKGDKNSETPTSTYLPEANHYTQISRGNLHDDLWSAHLEYQTNDSLPLSTKLSYGIIYGGLRSSSSFDQFGEADDLTSFESDYSMVGHRHTFRGDIKYNLTDKTTLDMGFVGKSGRLDDLVTYTPQSQHSFPLQNSDFTGKEAILGSHLSVKYSLSKQWSAKVGVRAEFSNNKFIIKDDDRTIDVNYRNWFPHITTTYDGENYQTSFGLVSGISYPDYEKILPAKRYVNEFLQSTGTVDVKPIKIYRFGWNQIFHQNFYIFSHYQFNKDIFGVIAFNLEDELTEYRYINYADQHNISASIGIP